MSAVAEAIYYVVQPEGFAGSAEKNFKALEGLLSFVRHVVLQLEDEEDLEANLWVASKDGNQLRLSASTDRLAMLESRSFQLDSSSLAKELFTRKPKYSISEFYKIPKAHRSQSQKRSWVVVPIKHNGKTQGVVSLASNKRMIADQTALKEIEKLVSRTFGTMRSEE